MKRTKKINLKKEYINLLYPNKHTQQKQLTAVIE